MTTARDVVGRACSLPLLAVVVIALAARLAVIVPVHDRPMDDPDNYLQIAGSLARGEGYRLKGRPTAYRPPLYPLLLTPIVRFGGRNSAYGVWTLNVALGGLTAALSYCAARRWGLSTRRAALAGLIVALDPVLAAQARLPMTETLSAATIALTLWLLAVGNDRWSAVGGGLALGLAALCRPSVLPAAGLIAAARLTDGPGGCRRRGALAAGLLAFTVAPLVPWAARNAAVFGEMVWTTTHGGYTLALANNPVYYEEVLHGPPGAVWGGPRQDAWWSELKRRTAGLLEPKADRVLAEIAWTTIRRRPGDFLHASAARLSRFWGLAPSGRVYPAPLRLATALWTAPLWIALAFGLSRRENWRWPRSAAPALLVGFTVVHAVFWTDLRMRAPLVPAVALLAATAGRRGGGPNPIPRPAEDAG